MAGAAAGAAPAGGRSGADRRLVFERELVERVAFFDARADVRLRLPLALIFRALVFLPVFRDALRAAAFRLPFRAVALRARLDPLEPPRVFFFRDGICLLPRASGSQRASGKQDCCPCP